MALAALSPFSTVSTTGSSRRISRRAESMSAVACLPGNLSLPAIKALIAALPALRWRAMRARGPMAGDCGVARVFTRAFFSASVAWFLAVSAV